jgi:hypothetical protein
MIKKAGFFTRTPWRIIHQPVLSQTGQPLNPGYAPCPKQVAASEEARRTPRYIEPLIDTRTTLAGFFSILLGGVTDVSVACDYYRKPCRVSR